MLSAVTKSWPSILDPGQLTGPILGKELRTSSRRKRGYVLRSGYLLLLTGLVAILWITAIGRIRMSAFTAIQMSEAGRLLMLCVVWLQFIFLQLAALVLLSTAMHEEIDRRTLVVLMTTPVTSRQLVWGKLSSRLLQLLQLMALSLPMLALLRVFGGIAWGPLLMGLAITLTAVLFVASLTLFFSICFRKPYVVLIAVIVTEAALFGFGAGMVFSIAEDYAASILMYINPYGAMYSVTAAVMDPSWGAWPYFWLVHAALMVVGALVLLRWCTLGIRKIALSTLTVQSRRRECKVPKRRTRATWLYRPYFLYDGIKAVFGPGMIWKEFLSPLLGRFRRWFMVGMPVALLVGVLLFLAAALTNIEFFEFILFIAIVSPLVLGVIVTITIPATCITVEKESRTWPLLMTTLMTDREILVGKFAGILRRVMLLWSPLLFFLVALVGSENMTLSVFLHFLALAGSVVGFIACSGLYFSARCRRSTAAALFNFAFPGLVWLLIPLVLVMVSDFSGVPSPWWEIFETWVDLTPAGVFRYLAQYNQAIDRGESFDTTKLLHAWLGYLAVHGTMAAVFLWRAKRLLRRNVFD